MLKRWIVYSILFLLIGLNTYFSLSNLLTKIFLIVMAVLSAIFFVFGIVKKRVLRIKHRSWSL